MVNQRVRPQFASVSNQTNITYVGRTLKELNKNVLSVIFGEAEGITVLAFMNSVNNFQ